jgi:hypothetical protein
MNIMAVATKDEVTLTVCFATLKDKAVNQIMNAINLEEIKARAIGVILRNKAMGVRPPGIMEKEQAEMEKSADEFKVLYHRHRS